MKRHYLLGTLLCSMMLLISSGMQASVAQPGQDLRTVCAGISTNVDAVLTCCINTFTALTTGQGSSLDGIHSSLDACCAAIEAGMSAVNGSMIDEFNATFTAIAGVQNVLGSKIDALAIPHDTSQIDVIESKLDACCTAIENDINAVNGSMIDGFSATFTAIAGVDACCLTVNSKVDELSSIVVTDFNGTLTALDTINTSLNMIVDSLNVLTESNLDIIVNTFTTLILVSNELLATLTQIEETVLFITATLGDVEALLINVDSEIDLLLGIIDDGFNHTFTALAGLQNDLNACCATIEADLNALNGSMIDEFNATFTSIAQLQNVVGSMIDALAIAHDTSQIDVIESKLDVCCVTLNSKVDSLQSLVVTDFNNTYTAIAGTQNVLSGKIDTLSALVTTDFNNTFTALAAIPAANFSGTYTALAAISNLITADFNSTMTAIAAVSSLITADFNSTMTAVAALSSLTTNNFNATFTALAAVSSLITSDFNGTFTVLAAASACAPIPLYQASVTNGGMLLTTSGALYCLTQNITGSIIISAANVTVDLNAHSLIGTIDILSTATNATIRNGNVKPAAPANSTDAAHAAIVIASTIDKALIKNCYVICADTVAAGVVGRDGIANGGTNTVIQGCFIQAGAGASGSNGGTGIQVTGSTAEIFDCTVFGGAGSAAGSAINQQSSNGKIFNNMVTGGVGTVSGGAGVQVTASTNDNFIKNCIASNCGDSGYSMLTTGTVNLSNCLSTYNTGHGFDLSSSTGRGLIRACVASQNSGCGFNDRVGSLYRYVVNAAEGNSSNPAGSPVTTADSNYCFTGTASTITVPSGPGTAPYYQWLVNTDGTFFGVSNWDNVSVQ